MQWLMRRLAAVMRCGGPLYVRHIEGTVARSSKLSASELCMCACLIRVYLPFYCNSRRRGTVSCSEVTVKKNQNPRRRELQSEVKRSKKSKIRDVVSCSEAKRSKKSKFRDVVSCSEAKRSKKSKIRDVVSCSEAKRSKKSKFRDVAS